MSSQDMEQLSTLSGQPDNMQWSGEANNDMSEQKTTREFVVPSDLVSEHHTRRFQETKRQMQHRNRTVWRGKFASKRKHLQLLMMQNPELYPIATMQLAATKIQCCFRGFRAREKIGVVSHHIREGSLPAEYLRQRRERRQELALIRAREEEEKAESARKAQEPSSVAQRKWSLLLNFFTIFGRYALRISLDELTNLYVHWVARKIQKIWRRKRQLRRDNYQRFAHIYGVAASEIQACWRAHAARKRRKEMQIERMRSAVRVISRAYVSYKSRQIYRFFRMLVRAANKANANMLCQALMAADNGLIMPSEGSYYVRFRLGGQRFPPSLYFRICSRMPVVDLGAFAPRDYVEDMRLKSQLYTLMHGAKDGVAGESVHPTIRRRKRAEIGLQLAKEVQERCWYRRQTRNGWRRIGWQVLQALTGNRKDHLEERSKWHQQPYVLPKRKRSVERKHATDSRSPKSVASIDSSTSISSENSESKSKSRYGRRAPRPAGYHHNRTVRQSDLMRFRKQKRRQWLRKAWRVADGSTEPVMNSLLDRPVPQKSLDSGPGKGSVEDGKSVHHQRSSTHGFSEKSQSPDTAHTVEGGGGGGVDDDEDLLRWTEALDFDSYHSQWLATGVASPPGAKVVAGMRVRQHSKHLD